MSGARLKSLVIENFRSLRGKIVVPLDAQVVLIHGTNGRGKTSILSALELGLTGKIAHLAADGDGYKRYLTTLDSAGGSIALTTTGPLQEGGATEGALAFSDTRFAPTPLLGPADSRFFAERCYLPQATLGRLLEIYDDQKTNSTSPLTLFVKELLGLDPLDALVDGLDPAFNITRIRRIAPDYRRLETLKTSLQQEIASADRTITENVTAAEERRDRLNVTLAGIAGDGPPDTVTDATDLPALRVRVSQAHVEDRRPANLGRMRSELRGLLLALHLSVPVKMPWLILDDPVQSMDDVHIAQFAALLRTLAKGMNRQVILAVHDRALFDYLTLELSPAFPGDSLIAVEILRNFQGEAIAAPRAFNFEADRAIAA